MTAGDARLDAIQARLDAATPGPWFQGRKGKRYEDTRDVYTEREVSKTSRDIGRIDYPEDAEFIANAPADVAFLLVELREAREALTRVERVTDEISAHSEGRGLDFTDDDFDRGWHGANRAAVARIRAAVAAANGDGE